MKHDPSPDHSLSLTAASLLVLVAGACASGDETQLGSTDLAQSPFGTLALALSSSSGEEEFRLVGSVAVLDATGALAASVEAAPDSPATQSVTLEPGQYGVSVADGYFCTYSGPATGFLGCTFLRANPNPFDIASGGVTPVALEVTLQFESRQDVTALFRTGTAEFRLAPSVDQITRCGAGPACGEGQICASLDGGGAECRVPCLTDADCAAPGECVSVFADPPGSAPSGVCDAAGGG